jgi:hypothetical protein
MIHNKQIGTDIKERSIVEQGMYSKNHTTYDHIVGSVSYTAPLFDFDPTIKPFLNETFGSAMNQDVSFTGVPELIFDGALNGWLGSAISGAWNFNDAGKVTISNASNNSQAKWDDAGTINMNGYTAITGNIDLDTYNPSLNTVVLSFSLAGVLVGNSINLDDYIDTGIFTEQSFVIPKSDLGIGAEVVDEMTITILRSGGTRPDIKFDGFQIEQIGTPLEFKVDTPESEVFFVHQINMSFVGAVTGITAVAGATENATVPNLSYNKLLGINELANGITFTRTQNDKKVINLTLKNLADFLGFSVILDHVSDGTNTLLTLSVMLDDPIVLDGKTNDKLSWTINDNISGLIKFTSIARGSLRSDPTAR